MLSECYKVTTVVTYQRDGEKSEQYSPSIMVNSFTDISRTYTGKKI